MVLTGAAGVGKTRLALELARRRLALGWMCRSVRSGGESGAVEAVRAVTSKPVLLIVDYAETRQDLAGLLREAADDDSDRVRVLLLARSTGEWWAQLAANTDATVRSLATSAGQIRVGPTIAGEADVVGLVRSAVEAFATALDVTMPGPLQVATPQRPVSLLVLHAAALLAVLNARDGQQDDPFCADDAEQVIDELLAREKAFWLGSARTSQLAGPNGIDSVVAAQAVAVACLIAVADEEAAARALLRIPSLADAPAGSRHKIARWLRQIYPADQPALAGAPRGWWGSLEPDLLAERHVVAQLATARDLASRCLHDLNMDEALGALTVLTRACAHEKDAPGLLAAALRADLANLALAAVRVAVQTGGSVGQILAGVLADADVPTDQLIMIHEAIPYPTVMLATADAVVAQRITDRMDDDVSKEDLARWSGLLSSRLAQAGQSADALPPALAAVGIYRELADATPGGYTAELAAALSDLAIRLYHLRRLEDAIAAGEEAVAIRRELAEHAPQQFLPDLAISLSNLGAVFAELGKPRDAIALAEESVSIHRQLAQAAPGLFLLDLAASLTNYAALCARLGLAEDARSAAEESLTIYRKLASANPDRFLPDLAISLTNVAALLADHGQLAEALLPSEQAVATYRRLAEVNPRRYRPDLATSLTNLGTQLSELGHPTDALAHCEEAVTIRRDLADLTPDGNRSDLAAALSNLAVCLAGTGRPQDALPPTDEAVGIYAALAEVNPDRYRPDLALALANLGIRLADLARPLDALAATRQAVRIYRELAEANPARYRRELADALGDLALRYSAQGKSTAAQIVSQEAVRIHRDLASRDPGRYLPRLATSLTNLGTILADLGRMTAALTTTEEALGIHQQLAVAHPDYYRAERASTLANVSRYRSALGHPADALEPARQAVTIYQELEEITPRFRPYLAISLDILAGITSSLGMTTEAENARAQATELRSRPNST